MNRHSLFKTNLKLPRLCTDRLVCRLLEPHEAKLMCSFRRENKNHLEKWEPLRKPSFFTESFWQAQLRAQLRDFREGVSANFSILDKDEVFIVGVCNYTNIVRGTFQSCQLGYAIAKQFEGQGLMEEALRTTNEFVFSQLGLHRIMAAYLPHNQRSGSLLDKLGFKREGFAEKYLKINGIWEDHVLTSKIRDL
ncbi:MAG: 30S ribosomal protein S5 alanine N-acetyltransferase [Gammaproteobacteria bacterium]|nr:30S ribosomal protein S5 alanine N-acetyltransferase [Gammaproteobacteria bacterium]